MENGDRILALDPSSTATGWAVLTVRGDVLAHGRWRGMDVAPSDRTAVSRVGSMATEARLVIAEHGPAAAILEEPSPNAKVPHVSYEYVEAFGRLYQVALDGVPRVDRVTAGQWSRGHSKQGRAEWIRATVPSYTGEGDGGLDEADAIGLGLWYVDRLRLGVAFDGGDGRIAPRRRGRKR